MKQEDDKVGCSIIRGMREDIAAMKKSRLPIPWIAWGFCILGGIVALGFLGRTFWPPRLPEKITYEIKLGEVNGEKACEAVIKQELAEALIAVEARAASDYNDKFITLLTVLTIFGIAWPLVVAFAHYKFNEKELEKIQCAEKNASESIAKANEAFSKTEVISRELMETNKAIKNSTATNWEMVSLIFETHILKMEKTGEDKLHHAHLPRPLYP